MLTLPQTLRCLTFGNNTAENEWVLVQSAHNCSIIASTLSEMNDLEISEKYYIMSDTFKSDVIGDTFLLNKNILLNCAKTNVNLHKWYGNIYGTCL